MIFDPASFFDILFPVLKSFFIPFGVSNLSVITCTHRTVIPAYLSIDFLLEGLATHIGGYVFYILPKIFEFLVLLSLLVLSCYK